MRRKKKPLTRIIQQQGLKDIQKYLAEGNDNLDTWKNGKYSSRIDYIFTSDDILEETLSNKILDINEFSTDHKALTITIKLKEKINYKKQEIFEKIKKESKYIKLEPEDWDIITTKVEEDLLAIENEHINREEMWDLFTNIYKENKNTRLKDLPPRKK
ncbi:hypothetical protein C1646_669365 [Rhizophagus diaphanus]|nr:hypothetical protein C1646_669365 [Rhizophagus diaphanus] [Rhizophagus sp. MUCL 43196]